MATYRITLAPMPGRHPDPRTCPLSPRDISADSEAEALEQAQCLIDHEVGFYWEMLEWDGEEAIAAAKKAPALSDEWVPVARLVERPAVDVAARPVAVDSLRGGQLVGRTFNYAENTGEQSFDVKVDGTVCGRLDQQQPGALDADTQVWRLIDGNGPLSSLVGRTWAASVGAGQVGAYQIAELALTDIRAALEEHSRAQRLLALAR